MEIFLGAEVFSDADWYWSNLRKEIEPKLSAALSEVDYGSELCKIYIISIIMPESYLNEGWHPERVYFARKKRSADIRLRINHKAFIRGTDEQRRQMYKNHIIECVERLRPRLNREFKFDLLIADIKKVLE